MMKELTDDLLCTEIFSLCMGKARSIEELTDKIYKHSYAKNIIRVYQTVETLMRRGILIPKFVSGSLLFQVNQDVLLNKVKDKNAK